MPTIDTVPSVLKGLTRDGWLLFFTRFMRLFAYGSLSVVLVFYLIALGLSESQTGILLTLTLLGDVVVSLLLTTRADRIGRRRMLIVGAVLMAAAGLAFACTKNLLLLIIAGTIRRSGHACAARIHHDACGNLPRRRGSIRRSGCSVGVLLYSPFACRGSEFAARRVAFARNDWELLRDRPFPGCGYEAFEFVRPGLVCRWFCGAELRRLLVLPAIRSKPWNTGCHFLLGKHLCGDFRTTGGPPGLALGPRQHDGGHTSPFQYLAYPCATDAQPLAGGFGSSGAF